MEIQYLCYDGLGWGLIIECLVHIGDLEMSYDSISNITHAKNEYGQSYDWLKCDRSNG